MKHKLQNERGDLSFLSIFLVVGINMIMAFVLLYASVQINCMNIRNAAKMELNNISARIYADTFHSQREANLESYMADLHISSAYQEVLKADFMMGFESRQPLETEDYKLENISLDFNQQSGKIGYVFDCDATFEIRMFGELFPPINQHITLTGSHIQKY